MLKLQSILKATVCLAAVALAAMGCSQDEWAHRSIRKGNIAITASVGSGGAGTRTHVGEEVEGQSSVLWNAGDVFGLFYSGGSSLSPNPEEFTCSEGGSSTATFTGSLETGVTTSYAVYPYQKGMILNDKTVSMTLPTTFTYTEASNGPMYADAKDISAGLQFKHLAGLLKLTVSEGIKAEAKKFVITADNAIAGTCTADLSNTDPAPFLKLTGEGSKTITVNLNFGEEKNTPTTFYIPILVGEYTTLSAQILGEGNNALTAAKEWENVTVERAQMLEAPPFGFKTIDASTDDLDKAIKEALSEVTSEKPVTTDLAISGTINTQEKSRIAIPVSQNSNVNLTLMEIPQNTATEPLELKDATSETTPAEAINTVTVAIPNANTSTAPSLTITMPKTTVVLDAMGSEGTTYKKVTATTASNTLVIEKDVIVEELVVKGGNVRVKGTVQKISKDPTLTPNPYLIVEDGATIPTEPTDFEVRNSLAYDIEMAMNKGDEYRLTSDISIIGKNIIVPEGKALTLDLNGYTITAANKDGDNILVLGELTLKDATEGTGKIVANNDYTNSYSTTLIYISGEDASFTMTGGTIEAVRSNDPLNKGQFGVGVFDGGDFTMTGGKIEAGWYAVAGNGNYKTQNSIINIKGGELISTADYAVYLPHNGTTTITGGKINGAAGGVAMQNGTLNISGNAQILSTDEGNTGSWPDGTGGLGNAALVINAGYGNCKVNITGGTISSLEKAALIDTPNTEYERTITISGGTFSDPSALAYLTAEAEVKVTLNKNIEITEPIVVGPSKSVLLDLNGHSIKPKGEQLGQVPNIVTQDAMVLVRRKANLTIDDTSNDKKGSIDACGKASIMCGVKLTDSNDEGSENAVLTVNAGTIIGYSYGISGNGLRHGTEMTINGGTIKATGAGKDAGYGIYHPQDGTLTVTGGTIEANNSGIEIRSGVLTISGGTISATAKEFKEEPNGGGATIIGAAIAVSQHVTDKDVNVTMSSGTLKGVYALYEKDLQNDKVDNIFIVEVTGGTLDGQVFSKNCKDFIKGCTFSDPSVFKYLASDAKVRVTLYEDIVITEPIVIEPSKKVTLDLGGHSITPQAEGLTTVLNTNDAMVLVRRGADLTIYDSGNGIGKIDASNATSVLCGIKLTDAADEKEGEVNPPPTANLLVSGGAIIGNSYGISGNGTRHGTEIKIIGGTIRAANKTGGTGIFHPQYGTLTVAGGTIEAYNSGIEIRSGVLDIKAGTINTAAKEFKEASNGNGTTVVGAAVAVSQHVTNKSLNVTIKGGTLNGNGYYALYEKDLQDDNVTGINMTVTGGILNGKVFSKNCKEFIKGGTFTNFNPAYPIDDTKSEYVAPGFTVMCEGQEATKPHSGDVNKTYEVEVKPQ